MGISTLHSSRRAIAWAMCGTMAAFVPAAGFAADEAAIEALRKEIADLRARVERLEGDVASGVPVNPARVIAPAEGGWRTPSNWELLAQGMGDDRVVEILGEADRVRAVGKYEFWHYGEGVVRFYLGRLKSWDRP